jgi:hypothetical protein
MRCAAQLELGQRQQALETAQLFSTVAADNADALAKAKQLFERFGMVLSVEAQPPSQ